MKYTLLQLTQDILSSMDSDEVNSISDTVESQQVAIIIRTVFNEIIDRAELSGKLKLFNLNSSGDSTQPTLMTLPGEAVDMRWLKYNKRLATEADDNFLEVYFLPVPEFLALTESYKVSVGNVGTFNWTTGNSIVPMYYRNNVAPTYYTSPDDFNIFFDSIDLGVDTTLQTSKTVAYGQTGLVFTMQDVFVPPLEDHQFSLLLNEAKALAHAELKQVSHAKAEMSARRQWVHLQAHRRTLPEHQDPLAEVRNYGRRGGYQSDFRDDVILRAMRSGK